MKLRIRKLLAAALVICLVVAMVPGAALASGAPNPFSIGSQTFATLQAAIDYTANYNNDPITLSSSYRLTDKVTLNSDKLIFSSGATLTIATGAELTVSSGGSLELNGSIVVEAGETPNGNGVLDVDVSNDFTGSGSLRDTRFRRESGVIVSPFAGVEYRLYPGIPGCAAAAAAYAPADFPPGPERVDTRELQRA